jgi:small conductance mechanosensitive channel
MNKFIEDLYSQILSYYGNLVDLLPKLFLGILVFIIFWFIARRAKRLAMKKLPHTIDDQLLANFLSQVVKITFMLIGILSFLQIIGLGKAASSLLAGAGIGAFIIGFAFKDIGENFLAGILMAFKRPFRIGDVVETGSITGVIKGLSLRETHIKTFDGKDVFYPNGMILKNPIINFTIDGFLRFDFITPLEYGANVTQAMQIIKEELPNVNGILVDDKAPSFNITSTEDNAIALTTYYWINISDKSISGLAVKNEAIERVFAKLQQAGFNIPTLVVELKKNGDPTVY